MSSEIAEKAAREAAEAVHKLYCKNYSVENGHFCEAATSCDALTIKPFVERAIAESQQSEPDTYGYCEYSAIHRETAHFREPGCVNWRPL